MASRHPKTLTCPSCAASGEVTFIKHAPLPRGDAAAKGETYYSARSTDTFTVETAQAKPKWQGMITCNACDTIVRDDTTTQSTGAT
jgi:hypothetical protein